MHPVKRIPPDEYRKICDAVPILCVDLIIRDEHDRYLLVKRKNEPLAGEWWVPGGRVYRNESPTEAARRIAQEEVGQVIYDIELAGVYHEIFRLSAASPNGISTTSIVFQCKRTDLNPSLDSQSDAWKWCGSLPSRFADNLIV